MKNLSKYLFLFTMGGSLYMTIELLYRQRSHWTMFLLGGICMVFFAQQGIWCQWKDPFWKQILRSTIFAISLEFVTGICVNKIMNWGVWDYSDQKIQLMGQICLLYAMMFAGLCVIGIGIAYLIVNHVYH